MAIEGGSAGAEQGKLHSKRVDKIWNCTRNERSRFETTLKRVERMWNYTRNEWRRCKTPPERSEFQGNMLSSAQGLLAEQSGTANQLTAEGTLEMSGEDQNYTRNEWRRSTLHSKRVEKINTTRVTSGEDQKYYTRNEWGRSKILHSKRVGKIKNMWLLFRN